MGGTWRAPERHFHEEAGAGNIVVVFSEEPDGLDTASVEQQGVGIVRSVAPGHIGLNRVMDSLDVMGSHVVSLISNDGGPAGDGACS